jgi:peptidoglycan/LPS O-acetylase OafA/YrhL
VNQFGFTLNALFWSCVLAVTIAGKEMFWHRWMKSNWLVWTGKYSYGMYVLHLPVYFLLGRISWFAAAVKDKTLPMAVIALVITCICSWLSYQLLEKRFLTLKPVNECAR